MSSETPLSTAEAARLAGVAPSSVKRWADEGLLPCTRTAGGHRRFLLSDMQRFLAAQEAQRRVRAEFQPEAWLSLLSQAEPHALLGALFTLRGQLGAWYRVADELGQLLVALGEQWQAGALTVLDEHLYSERLQRALAQVSAGLLPGVAERTCLLATAEGEEHTLGLALAELVLREGGWSTLWAGRGTPVGELVREVERSTPGMVALSASVSSTDGRRLAAQARKLAAACVRQGTAFVMGGQGAWPATLEGGRRIVDFATFHRLLRELSQESA